MLVFILPGAFGKIVTLIFAQHDGDIVNSPML